MAENLFSNAHKATNEAYRDNYDCIAWDITKKRKTIGNMFPMPKKSMDLYHKVFSNMPEQVPDEV